MFELRKLECFLIKAPKEKKRRKCVQQGWLRDDETNPELLNQKTRFGPAICQCHISLCLIHGVRPALQLSSIFIKYERQAHSSGHPAPHSPQTPVLPEHMSVKCQRRLFVFPIPSWDLPRDIKAPSLHFYENTVLLASNNSIVNDVL